MAQSNSYLTHRNGHYYFLRKQRGQQLRLSLRTQDLDCARRRAANLYLYTSQLKQLGLRHSELLRLSAIRVSQLVEEDLLFWLGDTSASLPTEKPFTRSSVKRQDKVARPLRIEDAIEDALRDLCRSGRTEHHRKYREAFAELSLLHPDTYFHDLRFAQASEHLQNLLRLPKRRTDRKPYKGMPIADVLELDVPSRELLSAVSINERMKRIARLWDWAAEHEACSGTNPFRSKTLRLPEKPRERERYTTDDLNVLFSSALFTDDEYRRGPGGRKSWWWLIMLGLYTGARVSELAQLRLEDVVEVDGVLCLSINDEGDKRVKTPAGIRLCPVHPELLRLGFGEYVEYFRRKGYLHVLPYPNQNATDPGQRCSKWYCGTYRVQQLPSSWSDRGLVFHSFRHTFINRAVRELHLELHSVQAIVGHEPDGMGETRRYAKGRLSAEDLLRTIGRIHYDVSPKVKPWNSLQYD